MAYSTYRSVPRTRNTNVRRSAYVEGNTVRKFNVVEELQKPLETKENGKKNHDKSLYMNLGYVLFLIGALAIAAMILMSYIRVQSDIIISVRNTVGVRIYF